MDERLKQQLEFVLEIDKEKNNFPPDPSVRSGQKRKRCGTRMAYGDHGVSAAGILQRAGGYRTGDADVPDTRYRGDRCRRYLCI